MIQDYSGKDFINIHSFSYHFLLYYMNMEKKVFDDEIQIIESFNPGLLIENKKPVKIYLDAFPVPELVELVKIVEDHGGEISRDVEAGVLILSSLNCSSEIKSPKFHVNWLHDCINSNRILNASKYLLKVPEIKTKHEVEVEDDHPIESINVQLQENCTTNSDSSTKDIIISEVFSLAQTHALPNIINENLVPEKTSETRRMPKCGSSQQPVHPSYDSPEENPSSKTKRYLRTTSPLLSSPIVSSSTIEPSTSNIELEVEKEDYRHLEPMNVELQQEKSADDYNNVREDRIEISEVVPTPQRKASTDDKNTVPEDISEIPGKPKCRRYSQQSVDTNCDSSKKNKSSKNTHYPYTKEEKRAMIQYVIDNDAIASAGGLKIWKKMHKDGMMQHHTPNSMAQYFNGFLRHRIEDLTSDEEALKKFQLRNIKLKRRARKRR